MKRLNKKEWKKTTKYIAGSAGAVSLAVASCVAGITGSTDVTKYDKEYLAGDDKASDTDATTVMNTDELADTLAENVNMTEKDVDKDETVYVFAKANGDVDNILVNETLKNRDKSDKIEDTTDLKDIVNVKGDETFTQNGNKITWDAAGNEISYQGTTDKELPVSVKATYYLDGNEISPEDLAGKSGKVKIRLDYTSNETVTKEVNGKDEDISVPFVAVSGMVLGDNFKNIQVTNGKYLAQGESNIVVGYAIPGLDDGVKDAAADLDTEIPEYVEVSADVTDFSLDMTVTLLVNGSEMNFSGGVDLTDLDKLTDSLSSAGDQLADGSGELSDGATQVSDGAGTLADKMGDLKSGAGSLKELRRSRRTRCRLCSSLACRQVRRAIRLWRDFAGTAQIFFRGSSRTGRWCCEKMRWGSRFGSEMRFCRRSMCATATVWRQGRCSSTRETAACRRRITRSSKSLAARGYCTRA